MKCIKVKYQIVVCSCKKGRQSKTSAYLQLPIYNKHTPSYQEVRSNSLNLIIPNTHKPTYQKSDITTNNMDNNINLSIMCGALLIYWHQSFVLWRVQPSTNALSPAQKNTWCILIHEYRFKVWNSLDLVAFGSNELFCCQ